MLFMKILFIFLNVVLFLNGLLPIQGNNRQFHNVASKIRKVASEKQFDTAVIMIVDAIRTDFVNSDYMPLTANLIKQHGCLINVSVASPTVTLPRIKSLITGSVPQFVDLFHNLGSPQALEDSILHQARKRGKQIVFYGDDTWLKIFPSDMFLRHSGTTSFYVTDFYEVDKNVTSHLDFELNRNDWDIMILHYLGLDHIGHVHGPFSNLVRPKLQEMDSVFSNIFNGLIQKNSTPLVILTGDHGMRDSGGHGGSTYSETHVPLGILGVPCDDGLIDQVDIAPNLAVLLNLDIPSLSIGKLTRLLLKSLSLDEFLLALDYNVELLSHKHIKSSDEFKNISSIFKAYLETGNVEIAFQAIKLFTDFSERVSRSLIESSSQQNPLVMTVSVISLYYSLITHLKGSDLFRKPFYNYIFYLILIIARSFSFDNLAIVPLSIAVIFQSIRYWQTNTRRMNTMISYIPGFVIFSQPVTWLSSSFIEEEHEFWYFMLNTFLVFQTLKAIKLKNYTCSLSWLFISIATRFVETMNQIGDKWASLPDTSDFLLKPENYHFHLAFLCLNVSILCYFCYKFYRNKFHLEKMILFLIFIYKIEGTNNIILARIIYTLLLLFLAISLDYLNSWIFLIFFLAKTHNLCLIPLSIYTSNQIFKDYKSNIVSTSLHLILSKCLYFMQGNGNNIANIDITVGYTALSNYSPVLVGTQLLINTYSSTILIHMLLFTSMNGREESFNFLYAERLYSTLIVCIVSLIFKNHIFIWTVYAPKLCIESCHTVIFIVEYLFYSLVSFCCNTFYRRFFTVK